MKKSEMPPNVEVTIAKHEIETSPDGLKSVVVTLETETGIYKRSASYSDYNDPKKRANIHRHWLKSISALEAEEKVTVEEAENEMKELDGEKL